MTPLLHYHSLSNELEIKRDSLLTSCHALSKLTEAGLSKHLANVIPAVAINNHPLLFQILKAIKTSSSADALESVSCSRIAVSLASLDSPHKIPCVLPTAVPRTIVASNYGRMQLLSDLHWSLLKLLRQVRLEILPTGSTPMTSRASSSGNSPCSAIGSLANPELSSLPRKAATISMSRMLVLGVRSAI